MKDPCEIIIRNVPLELRKRLRTLAISEEKSMNEVAIEAIRAKVEGAKCS